MSKQHTQDDFMSEECLDAENTKALLTHHSGSVRFKLIPRVREGDYSILDNSKQQLVGCLERFYNPTTYENSREFNPIIARELCARVEQTFVSGVAVEQLEEVLDGIDAVSDAYSKEHGMMTQAKFDEWKDNQLRNR